MSDEKIRILRVISRMNVGGPSLHVSYLSSALDELGYETTLAAGRVGTGEGSMEYVAHAYGVEPVFIQSLQREVAAREDLVAIRSVLRLIREKRPHILHTHTAKAGAVGRIAAQLAGPARPQVIVHTFHGHVLRGYFGPFAAGVFKQVERRLAPSTDALIAVSPEVRDDLVRLGVAPPERIHVIRLGLDLDARIGADPGSREAARSILGVPEGRFLVGWLGRMTEIKRIDLLLHGFARLRASGVDADLALVGGGPLRQEMQELAVQLGISESCHFVGYREDVGPLLTGFDAVALTSANEGTPVTLIEALAAGLPVVATDVGGVADVVPDGRAGFLVPSGDAAALAERLALLARDPELRRRLGEFGRTFVRDRYSIPRLVHDVDRLYRSLLEESRASAARRSLTPPIPSSLPPETRTRIPPAPRKLRVILLSQYFPPEVGATQSRMHSFAEYLSARGHKVTVIAEFPNHPEGVIPSRYRGHVVDDDRSNGYRVLRVWVKTSRQKNQTTRIAFYASFTGLATAVGPLAGRADVVLATSPPLFTGIAGVALARMNRAPLVLDVRDLWPAAAKALDQISGDWMLRSAVQLEKWLYGQAAAVTTVTRPFARHIDGRRGGRSAASLIPNGTLELFFEANGDRRARAALGIPDDVFLATFAGTHGIAQALPHVVDAAAETGDAVHFAFVGEGPVKEQLRERSTERRLRNVHFHPQLSLAEVGPVLGASDALLVPLSAHPTFHDFVPSKMIDFMAVGRPVVLSAAGEAARLLEISGGGVAVRPEDAPALAEALTWLREHPDAAEEMGRRGREFARRRMRIHQAERLEQVLLDVTRA